MIYLQAGDFLVACLVAAVFIGLAAYAVSKPRPPGPGNTWFHTYTGGGYYYRGGIGGPFNGGGASGAW